MSLTKATYSMIEGAPINVLDYGVIADGTTNNTVTLAAALAAVPANGTLYFPAGVYCGYLLLRRSNITIMGDGSASTTLKLPNSCPTITVPHDGVPNPITGLPNVIEVGECALGNAANTYSRINIVGLTIDGNYTNNTAPTTDLFGHGIILTKASYCSIEDVVAQNCYATGIDVVINSNYNRVNATTKSCGNAVIYGGRYPNFDINSSKFGLFDIISQGGAYGGRMLDNCWGNSITISVSAPSITGFVYNNQTVNESYANKLNIAVVGGCGLGQGMSVGSNCKNSIINANISGVTDIGFYVAGAATYTVSGNVFNVTTYNCGGSGVFAGGYCLHNVFNINSTKDGRTGASGSNFAVDVNGATYNQFTASVQEGASSQVRGFIFRAGSNYNRVLDVSFDPTLVQLYNDLGTSNYVNWASGSPADIASANAIDLPYSGSYFTITGTTGIVTITPSGAVKGRLITLRFVSSLTVSQKTTGASNIVLAGSVNFAATAGDTLTLISDGTDWVEVARAVI